MQFRWREPDFHLWPSTYQVGIVVALVSVSAFFIALIVAYSFAIGSRVPVHVRVPPLLWVSTAILAASSVALERARATLLRGRVDLYRRMIRFTLILGFAFLLSQMLSWAQLQSQRVFVRGNPHGSMFYMFTGAHGAHLAGGLVWIAYLLYRARKLTTISELELRAHRSLTGVGAVYWHFMGLLWLCLLAVLYQWA